MSFTKGLTFAGIFGEPAAFRWSSQTIAGRRTFPDESRHIDVSRSEVITTARMSFQYSLHDDFNFFVARHMFFQ